jgi:hypothetical protein
METFKSSSRLMKRPSLALSKIRAVLTPAGSGGNYFIKRVGEGREIRGKLQRKKRFNRRIKHIFMKGEYAICL